MKFAAVIEYSQDKAKVQEIRPAVVVVDPISNLTLERHDTAVRATLMRLIDFLKQEGTTAMFTSLTQDNFAAVAESEVGVSSLMDCWLLLANLEANGERTRTLQVVKSRGMAHSNQVREFVLGKNGVNLIDVYRAGSQVLIGTARTTEQGRAGGQATAVPRSSSLVTPRGRRAGKAAR